MTSNSLDLTIESALNDPIIRAAMRADRVDPESLEALLRTTAQRLDDVRGAPDVPLAVQAQRARRAACGTSTSW